MDLVKLTQNKGLSETEKRVLEYIVDNIDDVVNMGVRGIAKENFTSTSTIMRLAKRMGYSGFTEMYYALLPMIKNKAHVTDGHSDNEFFDSNYFAKVRSYIAEDTITAFCKLLSETEDQVIFIYATGFSAIAAQYMSRKLLVLGKRCIYSDGSYSVGVFENSINYMSCFMAFSKSGETQNVVDRAEKAKKKNIPVISFTNAHDNSLSELSDVLFPLEDIYALDDLNAMPNPFFAHVIMLIEYLIFRFYKYEEEKSDD